MVTLVLALAIAWLVLALSSRKRYLEVFRSALARPPGLEPGLLSVDFATAEMLVERLAAPDPDEVIRSAGVLVRRGRARLVPALLLYHPSARVLRYALQVLAESDRTDWLPLATPLLSHDNEGVRMAAVRALARRADRALLSTLAQREGPRMRGYAAVWQAVRDAGPDARAQLEALVEEAERETNGLLREGIIEAIADAPRDAQLGEAVLRLVDSNEPKLAVTPANMGAAADVLARAIARQGDGRLVPLLVQRLVTRVGREEVRNALVALGEPAFEALVAALHSGASPRALRVHIPRSLARFATTRAAEVLLSVLESDVDGLVRYKALRGLGRMVAESHMVVDPRRAIALAERNVREYLRLFAALTGLRTDRVQEDDGGSRRAGATLGLLEGLVTDKMRQALERTFRLLKIAHPGEDLQALYALAQSADRHASARAQAFVDALLTRRYERGLRKALQIALEPMTNGERVRLSRDLPGTEVPPQQHLAAVAYLAGDTDSFVSDIAIEHATSLRNDGLLDLARAAKSGRGGPERSEGRIRLLRVARA
ncbi:MAG: hypothetical protein HOO96_17165 [Polyangiaceae bacterium]|nr:hypothetical protein [Polyangiaceae bacterium]